MLNHPAQATTDGGKQLDPNPGADRRLFTSSSRRLPVALPCQLRLIGQGGLELSALSNATATCCATTCFMKAIRSRDRFAAAGSRIPSPQNVVARS